MLVLTLAMRTLWPIICWRMIRHLCSNVYWRLRRESQFILQQRLGLIKPPTPFCIPKYVLKKYLPRNPSVIDCGAHHGYDSVELARMFPGGKVYSFEPVPALYRQLVRVVRKYNNVRTFNVALSDVSGVANMYVSGGIHDGSSSLLKPAEVVVRQMGVSFANEIPVPVLALDDWARRHSVPCVDLMWLDMQGTELPTLKASEVVFPTVTAVHTEVNTATTYEGVTLYPQFREWMEASGFTVAVEAIPPGSPQGNVLFVRRSERP